MTSNCSVLIMACAALRIPPCYIGCESWKCPLLFAQSRTSRYEKSNSDIQMCSIHLTRNPCPDLQQNRS